MISLGPIIAHFYSPTINVPPPHLFNCSRHHICYNGCYILDGVTFLKDCL